MYIWLWVKTKRSPFVHIKIAGIYGSVNYPLTLIIIGFDTHPPTGDRGFRDFVH